MMKTEFYDKLYVAEVDEFASNELKDEHLVWVSRNWDWLYDKKPKKYECDILENYSLVFCESNEEFEDLDSRLDVKNTNVFDCSFEFKYPSLLVKSEYLKQCLS